MQVHDPLDPNCIAHRAVEELLDRSGRCVMPAVEQAAKEQDTNCSGRGSGDIFLCHIQNPARVRNLLSNPNPQMKCTVS
ncbi:hypothetical protein D3C76_897930 [compost metagenome]